MNDHKDLATARTPPEIWWNILEYTVGVDHLFADRIDGDEGAAVAWHDYFRTHAYFQQLETAKRQIRAISAVCKSWKQQNGRWK
ncbi:hypothetical protein FRC14_002583 [Serendipita sp. 396]|nr:hypothetical protein FRC14_002583 [Serendipita sp. 396]KAG8788477.1 hypothetical protein FRC15_004141 [Serendipita sp. 397]KAG8803558.1 hypothetical protein FRC16_004684 [Serendipita sp. 398]KAG8818012.1 hypothetical protein FRC18_000286 [Serendipita sp. 400]KAG8825173.1 hypothetical protein FRC19_011967 [Serendipita sp. 401]